MAATRRRWCSCALPRPGPASGCWPSPGGPGAFHDVWFRPPSGSAGSSLASRGGLIKGFDLAPVSLVVLIFYIYPLLATLLAVPLLGEPLTLGRLLLLALGIGGVALAVGSPGSIPIAGVALGLFAAVCVSVNIVASRVLMLRESINAIDLLPLVWLPPAISHERDRCSQGRRLSHRRDGLARWRRSRRARDVSRAAHVLHRRTQDRRLEHIASSRRSSRSSRCCSRSHSLRSR